jgi:single-stranded DNA-binding protein
MHLNSCVMIGCVSAKGAALRYTESGVPFCSFVLEVDELSQGKVYTTWIPIEIVGKHAEQTSVDLEAGDEVQISGKWKYRSTVDQKSGAKVSKPVVSSWGITQRQSAATTPGDVADSLSGDAALPQEPPSVPETPKGRPRYPKSNLLRNFISFYHQAYRAAVWSSRHEFIDAGAEFTRRYPICISSPSNHAA